jgi:hypothetical protein
VAGHDITADVAKVGERLSCAYRRTPQVTLQASSPAGFPTSVARIRLPRLPQVGQLAGTGAQHLYQPGLTAGETGHPGWGLDFDRGAGHHPRRGRRW